MAPCTLYSYGPCRTIFSAFNLDMISDFWGILQPCRGTSESYVAKLAQKYMEKPVDSICRGRE